MDVHSPRLEIDVSSGSVAVLGAGLIGLSCAWRLAREGWHVTVVDAAREAREASWAAAGMLAPHNEAHEPGILWRLGCESLARWPTFLADAHISESDVDYRQRGSLVPAIDDQDRKELEHRATFLRQAGVAVEIFDRQDLHRHEPHIGPEVHAALALPGAHVAPRLVMQHLINACNRLGVVMRLGCAVQNISRTQIELADASKVRADQVVLACGAWTPELAQQSGIQVHGEPVKGQMLRFATGDALLNRFIHSRHAYLVPRHHQGIVVGATMVEDGFNRDQDLHAIEVLAAGARRLVPALADVPIAESWTGLRPRLAGGLPLIDRHKNGVIVATGHFRNGILLAPITADLVAALAAGQEFGLDALPAPLRF